VSDREDTLGLGKLGLWCGVAAAIWLVAPLHATDPTVDQVVWILAVLGLFVGPGVASGTLLRRRWQRILVSSLFGLLAALYALGLMLSLVAGGPITGYETLDTLELPNSSVVAYRTNGGATTDFGIRIVQQIRIVPGIVLARELHHGYHEHEASLEAAGPDAVLVTIDGREARYTVRPHVYL